MNSDLLLVQQKISQRIVNELQQEKKAEKFITWQGNDRSWGRGKPGEILHNFGDFPDFLAMKQDWKCRSKTAIDWNHIKIMSIKKTQQWIETEEHFSVAPLKALSNDNNAQLDKIAT